MGILSTNNALLVADLFLFCYRCLFPSDTKADIIETFNSTSRYFDDDLLNIDNPYLEGMVI